jgi:hypothetical protein
MTLTLEPILRSTGIDPADAQVIRHEYVKEHEDNGRRHPGVHEPAVSEAAGFPRHPAAGLGKVTSP